jgi:hypothetical protein
MWRVSMMKALGLNKSINMDKDANKNSTFLSVGKGSILVYTSIY